MDSIDLILTTEAARILRVSAETIRQWERCGKLHARKTELGTRIFERRDIERVARELEERRSAAAEAGRMVAAGA